MEKERIDYAAPELKAMDYAVERGFAATIEDPIEIEDPDFYD